MSMELRYSVTGEYVPDIARVGRTHMVLNRLGFRWRIFDGERELSHGFVGGTGRIARWRAERQAQRGIHKQLMAREHLGCWPIDADHPVKPPVASVPGTANEETAQ